MPPTHPFLVSEESRIAFRPPAEPGCTDAPLNGNIYIPPIPVAPRHSFESDPIANRPKNLPHRAPGDMFKEADKRNAEKLRGVDLSGHPLSSSSSQPIDIAASKKYVAPLPPVIAPLPVNRVPPINTTTQKEDNTPPTLPKPKEQIKSRLLAKPTIKPSPNPSYLPNTHSVHKNKKLAFVVPKRRIDTFPAPAKYPPRIALPASQLRSHPATERLIKKALTEAEVKDQAAANGLVSRNVQRTDWNSLLDRLYYHGLFKRVVERMPLMNRPPFSHYNVERLNENKVRIPKEATQEERHEEVGEEGRSLIDTSRLEQLLRNRQTMGWEANRDLLIEQATRTIPETYLDEEEYM